MQTQNPKPKPRMTTNVEIGGNSLGYGDLRTLAQNEPKAFMPKMQRLIDEGKLRWNNVGDLKGVFHALADAQVETTVDVFGQRRTIMASAFPLLSGGLTVAGINDAYDAVPTIGEQLVTDFEDNKKQTTFAGVQVLDVNEERVDEGKDFPLIGASEEKYTIGHKRNGRRVQITAEMIEENDIAGITSRIAALGELAGDYIEEQTLRRVCDIDGSGASPAEPYVLHINGVGAALYQTDNSPLSRLSTSGNRVINNALVDETDLEGARARLASFTNERGKRINIPINQCTLLVPDALVSTADKILGSEMTPGVANELNAWGPRGRYRPNLLSSPKLDDLSTTAWYLGMFAKQFVRKWKLRFEYVTLTGDTESFLRSRLAFQARIAWDCEIGARDYVYVVQNLTASSAP